MATVGTGQLTLVDLAKRMDPNNQGIASIAEVLSKRMGLYRNIGFIQGNLKTGHRTTVRTGLPTGAWRVLNKGVPASKSTTAQIDETTAMLADISKVDVTLADLSGNAPAVRVSEDNAFLQGMAQTAARAMWYANSSFDPEQPMGLAPRYSDIAAENGQNIVDGGGTSTTNCSIWLIASSADTISGIVPQHIAAGIKVEDMGVDLVSDGSGGEYRAYRTWFEHHVGVMVRDWRYAVRIANIDVTELTSDASAGARIIDLMIKAQHLLQDYDTGAPRWYMNRTAMTTLDLHIANKPNAQFTVGEEEGRMKTFFRRIPIDLDDMLLDNEDQVD